MSQASIYNLIKGQYAKNNIRNEKQTILNIQLCCVSTETDFVLVSSCTNMHALRFLFYRMISIKQFISRTRTMCIYQSNMAQSVVLNSLNY